MSSHRVGPGSPVSGNTLRQRRASSVSVSHNLAAARVSTHEGPYESSESDQPSSDELDPPKSRHTDTTLLQRQHNSSCTVRYWHVALLLFLAASYFLGPWFQRPPQPSKVDHPPSNVHHATALTYELIPKANITAFETWYSSSKAPRDSIAARLSAINGNLSEALSNCPLMHEAFDRYQDYGTHLDRTFYYIKNDPIESRKKGEADVRFYIQLSSYAIYVGEMAQSEIKQMDELKELIEQIEALPLSTYSALASWLWLPLSEASRLLSLFQTHLRMSQFHLGYSDSLTSDVDLSAYGDTAVTRAAKHYEEALGLTSLLTGTDASGPSTMPKGNLAKNNLYERARSIFSAHQHTLSKMALVESNIDRAANLWMATQAMNANIANVKADVHWISRSLHSKFPFDFQHGDAAKSESLKYFRLATENSSTKLKEAVHALEDWRAQYHKKWVEGWRKPLEEERQTEEEAQREAFLATLQAY